LALLNSGKNSPEGFWIEAQRSLSPSGEFLGEFDCDNNEFRYNEDFNQFQERYVDNEQVGHTSSLISKAQK
jgi:hypothetical protein